MTTQFNNRTTSVLQQMIAAYRERRYRANQRFLAVEDRFKTLTIAATAPEAVMFHL